MELQGKQFHQQNTHLDLARFQNLSHAELILRMSVVHVWDLPLTVAHSGHRRLYNYCRNSPSANTTHISLLILLDNTRNLNYQQPGTTSYE